MTPTRDGRWQRIFQNVPSDMLIELAKKQPGHSVAKLYEDQESRVDEIFRVCDPETIRTLYEEFPGPYNLVTWFYRPASSLTKAQVEAALRKSVTEDMLNGIQPKVGEEPQLYKVERSSSSAFFRYVAADREQNLPLSFGDSETVKLLSYYEAVLHFSEVAALVFGPSSLRRADRVIGEMDSFLGVSGMWTLLRPEKGESSFYHAIKKKVGGFLIETKRHDPTGNYKTIALQARDKQPDLEQVPNFKKYYFDADSYYDVLQYTCKNKLGLSETVYVKFGSPFGRFTFGPGISQSAILYFQGKVGELLR